MSFFLQNKCSYDCDKSYDSLTDLILHIERDHIDFDPLTIRQLEEERPEALPLSYVLRFSKEDVVPTCESPDEVSAANEAVIQDLTEIGAEVVAPFTKNDFHFDLKEKKMTNEKRLTKDEIGHLVGNNELFTFDNNMKKPFACNMRGCKKRYKNVSGIRYHFKNYHKMLIPIVKKSLLKQKLNLESSKARMDKAHFPTASSYKINPQIPAGFTYHNIPHPDSSKVIPNQSLYQTAINTLNFPSTPSYKITPQTSTDFTYHNIPHHDSSKVIPNQTLYQFATLPTSDVQISTNQVPLVNNDSFNHDNMADVNGNSVDFSGRHLTDFTPSFNTF